MPLDGLKKHFHFDYIDKRDDTSRKSRFIIDKLETSFWDESIPRIYDDVHQMKTWG
jgi:hypothetical protein